MSKPEDKTTCPKCGKLMAECACSKEPAPAKAEKPEGEHIYVHHLNEPTAEKKEEKPASVVPPTEKVVEKVEKADEKKEPTVEEFKAELEKAKAKAEEYEAIIGATAMKAFETEKEKILSAYKDNEKQAVSDRIGDDPEKLEAEKQKLVEKTFKEEKDAFLSLEPDKDRREEMSRKIGTDVHILEDYKRMTNFLQEKLQEAGVKVAGTTGYAGGKVPQRQITLRPEDVEWQKFVTELYKLASDKDPKISAEANRKLDEIWIEVVRGLKQSQGRGIEFKMNACPKCGTLLGNQPEGQESCPNCGWQHYRPPKAM